MQVDFKSHRFLPMDYYSLDLIDQLDDLEYLQKSSGRIEKYLSAEVFYTLPKKAKLAGSRSLVSQNPKGTKPYRKECGEFIGFKSCDLGHLSPMFKSCNIITCPVCIRSAAGTKSFNITYKKILPFQNLLSKHNLKTLPVHAVFSPAEFDSSNLLELLSKNPEFDVRKYKWWCAKLSRLPRTYSSYKTLIDLIWTYFLSDYFHSSIIVYHPDRIIDEVRKISPHFHIIGWLKDQTYHEVFSKKRNRLIRLPNYIDGSAFYNTHGFNLKLIGSLHTADDIKRCLTYELSHTMIFERAVVRKKTEKQYKEDVFNYWLFSNPGVPSQTYSSIMRLGTYFYKGLISPYNLAKIGEQQKRFVLQTCSHTEKKNGKWVSCEGLMCEIRNVKMVHVKTGRVFTINQLHEFNIKIRYNEYKYWKVVPPDKPDYGFYLYSKVKYFDFKFRKHLLESDIGKWLTKY